jgi:hypothetical protein
MLLHAAGSSAKLSLVKQTLRDIAQIEGDSGSSLGFKRCGSLRVSSTPEEYESSEAALSLFQSHGVKADFISHQEA